MDDWARLEHAYGPATDIPDLMARLSPQADDVWTEVWTRLCHQGTVYPASFAALPALANVAAQFRPEERHEPLSLAGAIIASRQVVRGERDETLIEAVLPRLRALARESLPQPGRSQSDFVHLLQAARTFERDTFWGTRLYGLLDGELEGACPRCGKELFIVVGRYGFFTAIGDWATDRRVPSRPIRSNRGELPPDGAWMRDHASAAGQTEVVTWLTYLFGTGACPGCGVRFEVPEAIR